MSLACPKLFTITVNFPFPDPIVYYKLDSIPPGNEAHDYGPNHLDTNINNPIVTAVAGKITNAYSWGAAGVRYLNLVDPHLDLTGLSWTIRAWIKLNANPGFFYNYPFGLVATQILRLAAKGIGGTLPIPGSDSEARPYFAWAGGWVWSDQGNINSVMKDLAWHRVVVRYDLGSNTVGITIDNGTEDTAITGGAFPGVGVITPRMAGPDSGGAPADDVSTCEIGLWPFRWSDAQMLYDWNGGLGRTYP